MYNFSNAIIMRMNKNRRIKDGLRRLKDGSYVEGVAVGGKVLIVRTEPEFIRDIAPYFTNSIMVFITLMIFFTTNKYYLPIFLVFIFSPIDSFLGEGDFKNLSPKSESQFVNDKRFHFPL